MIVEVVQQEPWTLMRFVDEYKTEKWDEWKTKGFLMVKIISE